MPARRKSVLSRTAIKDFGLNFHSRVSDDLLEAMETLRSLGLKEKTEDYTKDVIPLLRGVLKKVDDHFKIDCSFLAVVNHSAERVSMIGITNAKEHLFNSTAVASSFLSDISSGKLYAAIPLRRKRYPGDHLWDQIRRGMALGPYAEPWAVAGLPLRMPSASGGIQIVRFDGYLILVGARRWKGLKRNDASVMLLASQLESVVKVLQTVSEMSRARNWLSELQSVDQNEVLHRVLAPLMNQELKISLAEREVKFVGRKKDTLELLASIRTFAFDAARAAQTHLSVSLPPPAELSFKLPAKDEWAQTERVVEQVRERLEPLAKEKKQEIVSYLQQIARIPMREADFELIVYNLLHNAIKYSYEGTRIEVRAVRREPDVAIGFVSHGIAVPTEEFERIFGPGYRTALASKMAYTAAGIGLSSARSKAEAYGGKLFVKDSRREGQTDEGDQYENTFVLIVPRQSKT